MSNPLEQAYVGSELELFAKATCWKRYWISKLQPFIKGEVLEVGAGIGSNTLLLAKTAGQRWVSLEPDPLLAEVLRAKVRTGAAGEQVEVRTGTLKALAPEEAFDTILYIDVLEHIENDHAEVRAALSHLKPGGRLVVLSPAHGWLFSPFDKAIGHFRRYTSVTLAKLTPPGARLTSLFYLDSVGLLASTGNRLLLRAPLPSPGQIRLWDKFMVPCSRALDQLTGFKLGRSVIGIWEAAAAT